MAIIVGKGVVIPTPSGQRSEPYRRHDMTTTTPGTIHPTPGVKNTGSTDGGAIFVWALVFAMVVLVLVAVLPVLFKVRSMV